MAVEQSPPDEKQPQTQAEVILGKLGGARHLCAVLAILGKRRNPATIYKWTYPREKGGTGGVVPTSAIADVQAAARYDGVLLTAEDWYRGMD